MPELRRARVAVCGGLRGVRCYLDPSRWDTGPSLANRVGSLWNAVTIGGYGLGVLGLIALGVCAYVFILA